MFRKRLRSVFTALIMNGLAGSSPGFAADVKSFDEEADSVTSALDCPHPTITPAEPGLGRLYGCILGRAETAKFWINEDAARVGRIANIKVMWNDWTRDIGYGLHADRAEAMMMVEVLADLYAPDLKSEIINAFQGEVPATFHTGQEQIDYSLFRGPGIDEHLLVLVPAQ